MYSEKYSPNGWSGRATKKFQAAFLRYEVAFGGVEEVQPKAFQACLIELVIDVFAQIALDVGHFESQLWSPVPSNAKQVLRNQPLVAAMLKNACQVDSAVTLLERRLTYGPDGKDEGRASFLLPHFG